MLSKVGPSVYWRAAETKGIDETKWRNRERSIFGPNIDGSILPVFYSIISLVFFPHLLCTSSKITGEISVCGRPCFSSIVNKGKGGGCKKNTQKIRKDCRGEERKKGFMLCSIAVFVERTLPFVCLEITYSAQARSSRGWAQASVKMENNEATAAQRIALTLCLGLLAVPPTLLHLHILPSHYQPI